MNKNYKKSLLLMVWLSITLNCLAQTITIQSPSNGATNINPNVEVWFNQISGLSKIEYEFDTDPAFGNAQGNKQAGSILTSSLYTGTLYPNGGQQDCYYFVKGGLKFGSTYYYRIRGFNSNNEPGAWSATRTLTTLSTLTIQSPSNGATNINPSVEVWFNQISGLSKIEYEFDTDPAFGNAQGNKQVGSILTSSLYTGTLYPNGGQQDCYYFVKGGLKFGSTYYYRIRGFNSNNDFSDWTPSRSLATLVNLTVQSPSNGATNINPSAEVWFNEISGLSKIEYEFDTDPAFGNTQGNNQTGSIVTSSLSSGILYPNGEQQDCYYFVKDGLKFELTYYYRIRGFNSNNDFSDGQPQEALIPLPHQL